MILGVIIVLFGLFAVFGLRDVGKRQFGEKTKSLTASVTPLKPACQCQTADVDECVPARVCRPPTAGPVAITGVSCDPNDTHLVYVGDVQEFVDASNAIRAEERKADAAVRLAAVAKSMTQPKK